MKKLITFTASWCGPCKMLKPILEQLHNEGLIVWENYDIDENKDYAKQMGIKSVPVLFFLDEKGMTFTKENGFIPRERILEIYGSPQTVAQIIESSEHFIKEDNVIVEEVEIVQEEPFVVDDEPNETVIEELEADISLLTPPQIAEDFEVIAFDEVYDDEFSDEDLGNDLPHTIDPDDLF